MKIRPVGADMFNADRHDTACSPISFRNFANAPEDYPGDRPPFFPQALQANTDNYL